jgi:hypothetical protein
VNSRLALTIQAVTAALLLILVVGLVVRPTTEEPVFTRPPIERPFVRYPAGWPQGPVRDKGQHIEVPFSE